MAAATSRIGMEYCFGIGDGAVTGWDSAPNVDLNGDGILDAVRLDFDGDGLFDDVLWDSDGDGRADHAAVDLDDDGQPETYYTDDGRGTWSFHVERDGPVAWFGLDGAEHHGGDADLDGDGRPEQLVDTDGNGVADRAVSQTDSGTTLFVDTDGDGRWDVRLGDTDGDGFADDSRVLPPPP